MLEPNVHPHALKHGIDTEDIVYAWMHHIALRHRNAPREGETVAIGPSRTGRLVQMVGIEEEGGVTIIHALSPPTEKVKDELRHRY